MHPIVYYRTPQHGTITAMICLRGRRYIHLIPHGGTGPTGHVAVQRVPLSEERYMVPVPLTYGSEKLYPVSRAKSVLRQRAKLCGATKEARRYLK